MIVINLVTVLVSGAAGVILGIPIGVTRANRLRARPTQAICPCGHSVAFHQDKTGRCHAEDEPVLNFRDATVTCKCQSYSGPELISQQAWRELALRDITLRDDDA